MTVYLHDRDFTLHLGDARTILAELPADSVDCVVTSPPYWGLRDYGTGTWDGGDPGCDHLAPERGGDGSTSGLNAKYQADGRLADDSHAHPRRQQFRDRCGMCGARRVDQQLGLEPTPDAYITNMVDVFRQVRRVLRPAGTLWLNIGDSYVAGQGGRQSAVGELPPVHREDRIEPGPRPDLPNPPSGWAERQMTTRTYPARATGLKPKDLVGIPWQLAFALRADGWYLRSEIIWAKPNPMPESVSDRPTKAHEQVFLLTKSPRYWYDQEAVRESSSWDRENKPAWNEKRAGTNARKHPTNRNAQSNGFAKWDTTQGRNIRSVWEIATEAFPDAHFATFPQELARRCILAGCPAEVCATCGKARERFVDKGELIRHQRILNSAGPTGPLGDQGANRARDGHIPGHYEPLTVGWSDCGHSNYRPGTVLDPFIGSGTVAHVARHHGRHTIGIELNADYAELAARRTQQQSLLADQAQLTLV